MPALRTPLLSSASIYLAANILNASVPFLLLPILTRVLEPSEYGQVALFQMVFAVFSAFVGLHTSGAAVRKNYDDVSKEDIAIYIGVCMQVLLASTVLLLLLVWPFSHTISGALEVPNSWIFIALFASSAFFIIKIRLGQWQVRGCALRYGVMQVGLSFTNAILSIVLVLVLAAGPSGPVAGHAIAFILTAVTAFYFLIKEDLVRWSWSPRLIKEALSYGLPLVPHVMGLFILSMVDRVFITRHLGLESAGVYVVAVQLAMALGIVFEAFNKAYVPWLFSKLQQNEESKKRQIVQGTYIYFFTALALASILGFVGPHIIELVAGKKFSDGAEVIGLLAFGQAFHGMYLMVTNYILYSRQTLWLSLSTICAATVHLSLLFIWVPRYGLRGAAYAFLFAMVLRFALTWYFAQRNHAMPWVRWA